jgi:hypothetical protein
METMRDFLGTLQRHAFSGTLFSEGTSLELAEMKLDV